MSAPHEIAKASLVEPGIRSVRFPPREAASWCDAVARASYPLRVDLILNNGQRVRVGPKKVRSYVRWTEFRIGQHRENWSMGA